MPDEMRDRLTEWAGGFGVRIEGFKQMVSEVAQSLGMTHRALREHAMNVALSEVWNDQHCPCPDVRVGKRWIGGREPVIPKDVLSVEELATWIRRRAEAAAVRYVRDEHGSLAGKEWTPRPDRRRDMPPTLWREPVTTPHARGRTAKLVDEARQILPHLPEGRPKSVVALIATGGARNLADAARILGDSSAATRKAFSRARELASKATVGPVVSAPKPE